MYCSNCTLLETIVKTVSSRKASLKHANANESAQHCESEVMQILVHTRTSNILYGGRVFLSEYCGVVDCGRALVCPLESLLVWPEKSRPRGCGLRVDGARRPARVSVRVCNWVWDLDRPRARSARSVHAEAGRRAISISINTRLVIDECRRRVSPNELVLLLPQTRIEPSCACRRGCRIHTHVLCVL